MSLTVQGSGSALRVVCRRPDGQEAEHFWHGYAPFRAARLGVNPAPAALADALWRSGTIQSVVTRAISLPPKETPMTSETVERRAPHEGACPH